MVNLFWGDKQYFKQQKEKLANQPITEESIKYNIDNGEKQKRLAVKFPRDTEENACGMSYSLTYKLLSENLAKGKRILTKKVLLSRSHNERKNLKGGIAKHGA